MRSLPATAILAAMMLAPLATPLATPARAAETATAPGAIDPALRAALSGHQRTAPFLARDAARHPLQELEFFGITPTSNVVEIWPAGGYWTEILAPVLHDRGSDAVALPPAKPGAPGSNATILRKLAAHPTLYDRVRTTTAGQGHYDIAAPGSADFVLTFRNLHNWMRGGYAEPMLAGFYRALKPGGILGIEEHRAHGTAPQDPRAENGYVRQDYATRLIEQAGFRLVGSSEINANPRDTANWPGGVWTLPPTYALGDRDREKYRAIGEGDNFVLKFRKP